MGRIESLVSQRPRNGRGARLRGSGTRHPGDPGCGRCREAGALSVRAALNPRRQAGNRRGFRESARELLRPSYGRDQADQALEHTYPFMSIEEIPLSSEKPTILHMLTAAPNLSPFDVNMAIDAGWQHCIPYSGIGIADVQAYTQDAIFSRGPKGVKRTGIFIGGRDMHLAVDMLEAARASMVPPFEVSVFADPSGAFTTAAGMVACAEKQLRLHNNLPLAGRRTLIFGGTGPVGSTCAVLAAKAGARVAIVSHKDIDKARDAAELCAGRYGVDIEGVDGSSDAAIMALMTDAELVFGAAAAGIQILSRRHLEVAECLAVVCDVNAVPPEGVEGVGVMSNGVPIEGTRSGARGIGALAVGNVKYETQRALLRCMLDGGPHYLHFERALELARDYA